MTPDLAAFLRRQMALMAEYCSLAELYAEVHGRLKIGTGDRQACQVELNRIRHKLISLHDRIEAGRDLLLSRTPTEAPS